jgi:hypothetical protein
VDIAGLVASVEAGVAGACAFTKFIAQTKRTAKSHCIFFILFVLLKIN